jgi:prefoldin alpha subunit
MQKNKTEKIVEFEKFVNEKLRTDLQRVLEEQEKIYSEIAEYLQVKDTIYKINQLSKQKQASSVFKLNTRVDLGCNFYANAVVEDPTKICVAIGYGFFLDMTFDEALKFIEKKVKLLHDSANELTQKACEIKANIKFVLEGIREMQEIKYGADETEKKSLFI